MKQDTEGENTGFFDRFKKQEQKQEPEKPKARPVSGAISMLWGMPGRRPADQDELKELQEVMAADAEAKIARYAPVLDSEPPEPTFGDLSSKEAGLLQVIHDNVITDDGMTPIFGSILEMEVKDWGPALRKLTDLGYIDFGDLRVRINDAKYSVLLERLKDNGITISTTDKTARVDEIISKAGPELLKSILSDVPERFTVTPEGTEFLAAHPILGEYYIDECHGISIGQAIILKQIGGDGDLFKLCQKMYMELMEAYWSLKRYKEYLEYSELLAYLDMHRCPKESAYALAHLINANSIYKSGKILWATPLRTVYANSSLTVEQLAEYAADEFAMGIYPKRTKVDKFPEVFMQYLEGNRKR